MPLAVGTLIGPYEIDRLLGTGGMGEVYRARDPRLNRFVALKVVPDDYASSATRRERFRREAQAIAALNHPNIVTIYAAEEAADGSLILTMELVDGKALAELIPKGGMAPDRLLKLAVQIADAIGAAHERGIAHRDIKPRNVMVTPDGRVKVLDFGLAKLRDPAGDGLHTHSTAPTWELTGEGRIVGTAAYMSPEQAEGRPVDHRTDLFSLGTVLYEMTLGQRPFAGESIVSVLSAILRDTPRSATDVNPRVPRELSRIIRRCLAKDPDERYQSAKDLRNDLNDLRQELSSAEAAGPRVPRQARSWRRLAFPVAGVALSVAAGWLLARFTTPRAVSPLPINVMQLTFEPGIEGSPSVSPDGRWVVYDRVVAGHQDVFLQAVGGERPINLTEGSGASNFQPVFSPDGERIAFASTRQSGGLFVMGRTGELVRRVTARGASPSWAPDGKQLAYSTSTSSDNPYVHPGGGEIWIVDLDTGAERVIVKESAVRPAWSPNGYRIAYWALDPTTGYRDIWTVSPDGSAPARVTNDAAADGSPAWAPDGRALYFSSDRGGPLNLWHVAMDERRGTVTGEPEPVTTPSPAAVRPTLSRDGKRLAYRTMISEGRVRTAPMDPAMRTAAGAPVWLLGGPHHWSGMALSPDGTRLALVRWAANQQDLFVVGADGTGLRRLTGDVASARCPTWAPDNKSVAFVSVLRSERHVLLVDADSGVVRRFGPVGTAGFLGCPVWSPDGTRMAISQGPSEPAAFVFEPMRSWTEALADRLPDPPAGTFVPRSWSPDGRFLAGTADSSLMTFDLVSRRFAQVTPRGSIGAGARSQWTRDGRHVVFHAAPGDNLMSVDVATKEMRPVISTTPETIRGFGITPDGGRLFVTSGPEEGDVWIATLR
jgi:serine/threonine protein kinase/Tol biopolymer transport system component